METKKSWYNRIFNRSTMAEIGLAILWLAVFGTLTAGGITALVLFPPVALLAPVAALVGTTAAMVLGVTSIVVGSALAANIASVIGLMISGGIISLLNRFTKTESPSASAEQKEPETTMKDKPEDYLDEPGPHNPGYVEYGTDQVEKITNGQKFEHSSKLQDNLSIPASVNTTPVSSTPVDTPETATNPNTQNGNLFNQFVGLISGGGIISQNMEQKELDDYERMLYNKVPCGTDQVEKISVTQEAEDSRKLQDNLSTTASVGTTETEENTDAHNGTFLDQIVSYISGGGFFSQNVQQEKPEDYLDKPGPFNPGYVEYGIDQTENKLNG